MSTPMQNFGRGNDPFADLMNSKKIFYALTSETIQQLESGTLTSTSGDSLQLRRITPEMMKNNQRLIAEVHAMALLGQLGFSSHGNRNISFRNDIAEKIGQSRNIQVFNPEDLEHSEDEFNAEIGAVDDIEYSNLTEQHLILEALEVVEDKEVEHESEHKQQHEVKKTEHHRAAAAPKEEKLLPKQQFVVRQVADSILQQSRVNEERRREHAAEERDKEAKRERKEVKREVEMREIKNAEISQAEKVASQKRQERAFGEEIDVSPAKQKGMGIPAKPSQKVKKRKLH